MTRKDFDDFDDADEGPDAETVADILEAHPGLGLIRPFIAAARNAPWFTALGEPPRRTIRTLAQRYMDGLGFPDITLTPLATWEDAADAAVSLDWDTAAWEAEEGLRAALTTEVLDQIGEDAFEIAMTHLAAEVTPPIRLAAGTNAGLWNMRDIAAINAAVGSAVQTCHLAALTLIAGEADEDHPFMAKLALYEAGRWPVGITGASFNLF